jgi:hypothetical protein
MVEAFLGIQIISISFAGFMLYITFLHSKRGSLNKIEFYSWVFLWLAFIYFALFPKVLDPILAQLFVARTMDLLMIAAFMILAYLGFQNYIEIKNLQKQIRRMVSQKAIKKASKK